MNQKLTHPFQKSLCYIAYMTYIKAERAYNTHDGCGNLQSLPTALRRLYFKRFYIIERKFFHRSKNQIQKTSKLFNIISRRLAQIRRLIIIYKLSPHLYKDYYQRTSLGLLLLNMYLLTPKSENANLEKLILYTTCPSLINRNCNITAKEMLIRKDVTDEFVAILYEIRLFCILTEPLNNI